MSDIIEAANLPQEEKVYLKKDWFGWRVVEPPSKWYHYILGSKRNIFILLFLLLIFGLFFVGVNEMVSAYKSLADNPCLYCKTCSYNNMKVDIDIPKLNLSFSE